MQEKRKPLNLNTFGGVVGAILDRRYPIRRDAAKALGVHEISLSNLISGNGVQTKKWWQSPSGIEGKTRLTITCYHTGHTC